LVNAVSLRTKLHRCSSRYFPTAVGRPVSSCHSDTCNSLDNALARRTSLHPTADSAATATVSSLNSPSSHCPLTPSYRIRVGAGIRGACGRVLMRLYLRSAGHIHGIIRFGVRFRTMPDLEVFYTGLSREEFIDLAGSQRNYLAVRLNSSIDSSIDSSIADSDLNITKFVYSQRCVTQPNDQPSWRERPEDSPWAVPQHCWWPIDVEVVVTALCARRGDFQWRLCRCPCGPYRGGSGHIGWEMGRKCARTMTDRWFSCTCTRLSGVCCRNICGVVRFLRPVITS
jgi:hypothetical protein